MLKITQRNEHIVLLHHEGPWEDDDLKLYRQAVEALIHSTEHSVYLALDFSQTTRVNPNRLSEFLGAPIWADKRIRLCAIVCSSPLQRFVQQVLQLMVMRHQPTPLQLATSLEEAEAALVRKQMLDSALIPTL